jgi:hypothetical protein
VVIDVSKYATLKSNFFVNLKQYDGYEQSLFNFWFDIIFFWSQMMKYCLESGDDDDDDDDVLYH